ncbi:acyl-CoA dehydrogenase C-terminal domain-containing protein [Stenotrophomonas mori]|uniref:Acyl-CoA dehydrogenase C-terminal domain-containing protein n=1 Tax=Stenotrophomonas mori TaxID=2871096 RepID=A0ABT0SFI6_9GAMM|nr:acyl-CoA dehydrogenase C-terminal domain-containing protein [Stenotrophomonas mori]MCL7714086.1 acyl-CoA dehydrogenase C-terminal domain-containing protein [Stenotrophomonas mori]
MSNYTAPVTDLRFALHDVLGAETLFAAMGLEEASADVIDAVLEEAGRFSASVLAPLNAVGDQTGCTLDKATGDVTTAPGFKEAYAQFVEGGWTGLTAAAEFGGQGMPETLGMALSEMVSSANLAWSLFPMLSHGAVEALKHYGEDWQKEAFLKPLVAGRWTGTMCLTEPHAGTDLGLLKTRAEANADGSYSITGTKIFITAGEHDLSENIVHLVLAKLPDAPPGPKGISLFVTPKYKVDRDGNQGERNALRCGALEHKMGIHGSSTCVMNFDGAQGYLVGEAHKGLQAMFVMMNSARLGVGVQGLAQSERAYQGALAYARERLQSRAPKGPLLADKPADPIIAQPDVRRMLLTTKALTEGGRLLAAHAYTQLDAAQHAGDEQVRADADTLVSFLTPIVKACLTEWSIEATYNGQQVFGGHGYIAEHGMEQYARDARITTLYEGTTGIQALDLIGRKTAVSQGAGLKLFLAEIEQFIADSADNPAVAEFLPVLGAKAREWGTLTANVLQRAAGNPEELGATSWDYLFYSGYVALAYWWARAAAAAQASGHTDGFKQAKRETARFYYARILPRTLLHAAAMESGAAPLMAMDAEHFGG